MFYVFPSETNFLLVKILKRGITARSLKEKLAERGILIRDCGDFPGLDESYFRITIRNTEENLTLIAALKETFASKSRVLYPK
jgi:threonine-phosphate decarboxylase